MRYLFGPVTPAFVDQNLHDARHAGDCLTFGTATGVDLVLGPAETWESLAARFPSGWQPDFVALYLPYTIVPGFLWSAPIPIVGLAADWNLLWHGYRHVLRDCDLVLTDTPGVKVLHEAGIGHARAANLFGLERRFLEFAWPDEPARDIDVLFVGNLHPSVQCARLPWLGRLARLADRRHVAIRSGVFGEEYCRLLARARIVFNRSIRGECNKRVFEALAAGALLFQEVGNNEVACLLGDRVECVYYDDHNLEVLLDHFLENEPERHRVAAAAHARLPEFSFERLWQRAIDDVVVPALSDMQDRGRRTGDRRLVARTWQQISASEDQDSSLAVDLAAALAMEPNRAELHNALGLVTANSQHGRGPVHAGHAATVLGYLERAVAADPDNVTVGLNRVECLAALDHKEAAVVQAQALLRTIDPGVVATALDVPHFPAGFDPFRVEWERAAWQHAGAPGREAVAKTDLLRWRLHFLLAELTGELPHYHEAALAQPDLPITRAMLGCALARAGRLADAVPHLRRAVIDNPFDLVAARALYQVLGDMGDRRGQARLARDRRLLAQAAPQAVPTEEWFSAAPWAGDELASLLILCHNELEVTRQCLTSIVQHTRRPYELVIVDNASSDGTPDFLAEFAKASGPERVVVLRNEDNRGFAAGCNQALAEARGAYAVFLNNDTVVTPSWLDRLITCALADWPHIGMVGPVTNYSRPPQQVPVDYADLAGLLPFAARRQREFAGQALAVERLTGFCLLARRDVLQAIGGFDEGYGIGFFEDDDLCVRAQQAGYRLFVALDVFVHHHGSRTFRSLGVDCARQLHDNFQKFHAKWGAEHSAGYRVPGLPPAPPTNAFEPTPEADTVNTVARALAAAPTAIVSAPRSGRPRVSLCLIVKNEEHNLPDCLGSVADLVDEVIVVDTGSSDRTKEVAERFGTQVFDFPWVDSFAAARNESLAHATGEWIFWMDADDRLDDANRHKLRSLLAELPDDHGAFVMKCLCLPDPVSKTATVVDHVRLFRNHPDVRWQYRVHEQILPALRRQGAQVRWSDVVIQHVGYQDLALRKRKLERDTRLLHLEDQEHPDDPFTLFNLGSVYQELQKSAEALPLLRRSLERSQPADSIVRKLYALIAQCHRQLHEIPAALAACVKGREFYPDDAELLFQEALVRRELDDSAGAERCWLRLIHGAESAHFASVDTGLRGHKARHNLAVQYQEQGRSAEAEAQWRAAVTEEPGFLPAWLGLADLVLAQGRWPDLAAVTKRLVHAGGPLEALVLEGRGLLARQEFAAARRVLEEAVQQHPEALWPRRILSHVLLQEGRDWEAAERSLQGILALAPEDKEARGNLAVLRRQRATMGSPLAVASSS